MGKSRRWDTASREFLWLAVICKRLPVRQWKQSCLRRDISSISKLPVRQWTFLRYSQPLTQFFKLPVRQWTTSYARILPGWFSKLPVRQWTNFTLKCCWSILSKLPVRQWTVGFSGLRFERQKIIPLWDEIPSFLCSSRDSVKSRS